MRYCARGTISASAINDRLRYGCVFTCAAWCSLHSFVAYCYRAAFAAWPRHRAHVYLATGIMFSGTSAALLWARLNLDRSCLFYCLITVETCDLLSVARSFYVNCLVADSNNNKAAPSVHSLVPQV